MFVERELTSPAPTTGAAHRDRGGFRPGRRALVGGLICLLLLGLSHPWRVGVKTLLLLPEMFPEAPVRPLLWVSAAPRREEYSFESPAGRVDSDLYLPAGGGQHGAVILFAGVFGLRREPALVRLAEGLSRAGAVVMVPEAASLQEGDISPEQVEGLRQAIGYLRARSEVDPSRAGLLGFSAGGSLALLAAEEDERGVGEAAFLNVFGAYYDAQELLRAVASHQIDVDGQVVAWEPADVTVWEFRKLVIATLPDPRDRDILTGAFPDRPPGRTDELGRSPQMDAWRSSCSATRRPTGSTRSSRPCRPVAARAWLPCRPASGSVRCGPGCT